jgi:hypothetical protein
VPTEYLPTKKTRSSQDITFSTHKDQWLVCPIYSIQELMTDLDNIQIWKVEKMQDKEVQGSKSNLNFKVIVFVIVQFSYQDW